MMAASGGLFLCWVGLGALAGRRWIESSGATTWIGAIRRTFFSWPSWTEALVQPWSADLPVLGVMTLVSIAVVLMSRLRCSWTELFQGPVGILVYGILVFGLVRYTHESARYHFLFYPVVLATLAAAALRLAGPGRAFLMFAAAFMLSGDFNPSHIAAAGQPTVAFRIGPFAQKAQLWYPRADYEGAADYLQNVVKEAPDELFVVRACPPVARHFQPRRYASYHPRSSLRFYELSRERGTRDLWEQRLLLSNFEELREASRSDRTVWLIQPLWRATEFQPEVIWGGRLERVTQEFLSRDGGIQVLRVSLKRQ